MAEEIIFQMTGLTIASTDEATTNVPYGGIDRGDGNVNHGYIELRDHPENVDLVPETSKSQALAGLLRAIADPASHIMSSTCECALFDRSTEGLQPRFQAGGFVNVMLRDEAANQIPQNHIDLAYYIAEGIAPSDNHVACYEMIVEPLRGFFGLGGHYSLLVKPIGFGDTSEAAWAAFEYATDAIRRSIVRGRSIETGASE